MAFDLKTLTPAVSISDTSYIFGAAGGAGDAAPEPITALVIWTYIQGKTDALYYTETEVNTLLAGKSAVGHGHLAADISDSGATGRALLQSASAAVAKTALSLVKADVGLANVDNTSDVNKPVSTATATALALKAPLSSPAFTDTPTVPTAAPGTNTTQVASTGFVKAAIDVVLGGVSAAFDTLSEIATALAGKSDVGHTHSGLAPAGGTINQVLKKLSSTNYDYAWANDATGGGGLSDGDYGDITVSGGATVFTIDVGVVTNAKLAVVATSTIKGRATAATGAPEDLSAAQVRTIINVADGANNYVHPNHTGDVTSVGDGAQTIAARAVTFAKFTAIATARFLGRVTAASGDVEELTAAQVKTALAIAASDVSGLAASATTNTTNAANISSGTLAAARLPAFGGGDVSFATAGGAGTIANAAVTYAKLQNVSATSRVLGRKTAAAGDAEELTLSELMDFIGSAAQGDILYRGASAWARLAAGTSGQFLKTLGAGANPLWDTPAGGGAPDGALRSVQVFTASGTWTRPSGLVRAEVFVVGGGGGGGHIASSNARSGGGGGGGGLAYKVVETGALGATETVTIGAGGAGGTDADGTAGGTSSFGAHCSATGGGAGTSTPASASGGGGAGSGGTINLTGRRGGPSVNLTNGGGISSGGDSPWGFGRGGVAPAYVNSDGNPGNGYGAGGSGGQRSATGTSQTGGAGVAGIVIVKEYF